MMQNPIFHNYLNFYAIILTCTVGFTIGFSQLLFTISEGDGPVRVCAELTSGEIPDKLGVVSLSVMANVAKSSGIGTQYSVLLLTANKTQ